MGLDAVPRGVLAGEAFIEKVIQLRVPTGVTTSAGMDTLGHPVKRIDEKPAVRAPREPYGECANLGREIL